MIPHCIQFEEAAEPLVVEPISVVRPASASQELRMTVHEPASTEAPEAEDIPAAEPTAAEDIGHDDNVDFCSEAVVVTFGFEPVMLLGKIMRGASWLEGAGWSAGSFFFFFAAILGSMPGRPSDLRFSASL